MMIIIVIGVVYESLRFHISRFNFNNNINNFQSNLNVKIISFERGEAAEAFLLLYFDFGNIRKLAKMAKPGGDNIILNVPTDKKRREPPLHGAAAQCQCC